LETPGIYGTDVSVQRVTKRFKRSDENFKSKCNRREIALDYHSHVGGPKNASGEVKLAVIKKLKI